MKIYKDYSEIKFDKNTVISIGTFDGLHLGHANLLNEVVKRASDNNSRSFVVTFEPHPRVVVSESGKVKLLTCMDVKIPLFEKMGIDNLYVINFTKEFSRLGFDAFVEEYLVKRIGVKHIVLGHDHKFGKDRAGDESKMRLLGEKFDFEITTIPAITKEDKIISSTLIRNLLESGETGEAKKFLGRYYEIPGEVVDGVKRGRLLGFPTANIKPKSDNLLIPANGVYVVKCDVEERTLYGVMNIGLRPTFGDVNSVQLEVHIFDFHEDIYGKDITLNFLKRLRPEKKFESKEELIYQINKDKKDALRFLGSIIN
ncbi:MAG: riboflavin biosynthesis protein [Melioribacteraceae bacterium]|nr:MAG: riboflavin biosynthesis protein [Melioribacteraceae bacterium]